MIDAKDLWMLFGLNAGQRRSLLNQTGDITERAARIRSAGGIVAVAGVTFDVKPGELFVIMGLSGSGKSTLIRCLSRLADPTSGEVSIEGENILAASKQRMIALRREKLGMVFQHFGLFPHMTVLDNVAFPLRVQRISKSEQRARAREVIELVGLAGREDAYPRELSGGQRQRVGIARSLAVNPQLWFLDEPFSALDPLIRRQLQDELLRLQASLNKTIVFITHDISEAMRLADRMAIMRDGEIIQIGTPSEIVLNPVDDYVAEFSRDIPRGQVMTLGALANAADGTTEPAQAPLDGQIRLPASLTLDQAMAACANSLGSIAVEGPDGKLVSSVSSESIARALVGSRPTAG